ncbi:hypothetical protein BKK81_28000 [Cupriavidus sp. USMAHM13]|uniref:hypothetical protein n=1 Tax=Cupriavidus sp. USMAHM13 TaxID=1389192 RepID=UPI0008A69A0B|nr:hypothetical protein [Cupriavidus sp. USMAHM13]AOZ02999.1 hypothetical protein BKK81_28000 [Cupriavidus sp. USMAHM13]
MQDDTPEHQRLALDFHQRHLNWLRLAIRRYRERDPVASVTLSEPYRAGWIEWEGQTYYYVCGVDAQSMLRLGQVFCAAAPGTLALVDPIAYPPPILGLFALGPPSLYFRSARERSLDAGPDPSAGLSATHGI